MTDSKRDAGPGEAAEHTLDVWQGGIMVASVSGANVKDVAREAMHYAAVYGQDGPVEIRGNHAVEIFRLAQALQAQDADRSWPPRPRAGGWAR